MPEARRYERARKHQETRQRIVDALIELHETVGAAQTTVVDVARRAGVGRMTVYNHFPTEADMVVACTSSRRRRAVGALGLVVDFATWSTLTRSGLSETEAAEVATAFVAASPGPAVARA